MKNVSFNKKRPIDEIMASTKTKEIIKSKTLFNKSSLLIIPSSFLSFDLSYLSSLYDIILMSSSIPSKNIMQINLN